MKAKETKPDINLQEAMDRLKVKQKPSMDTKEAIEKLDEIGNFLYENVGTDSYNERCKLHDIRAFLSYTPQSQPTEPTQYEIDMIIGFIQADANSEAEKIAKINGFALSHLPKVESHVSEEETPPEFNIINTDTELRISYKGISFESVISKVGDGATLNQATPTWKYIEWLLSRVSKPQVKWISVEDRMPEPHKENGSYYAKVRAVFKLSGTVMNEDVVWSENEEFIWMGIDVTDLVTHWQPLPSPPSKEEKKEEETKKCNRCKKSGVEGRLNCYGHCYSCSDAF